MNEGGAEEPVGKTNAGGQRLSPPRGACWEPSEPFGAQESREESRQVQYFGEEEGTTMGCNKFWGKFSCEAIRALPTFRPGSNRIANLLTNRIGTYRI